MGETAGGATATIRILHVDDEPDFADLAATFLERENERFEIETATSASGGLDRLSETSFDCIVSDYDMPGQNGIEFLESVREEYPDLPFILYTGKGSEEVASEAISAGVTDYLQKGQGTDQYAVLENRVTNVVERYRSQRALAERNQELQRYRQMINSMNEAACIYDSEGRFELVNEYLAEWYDATPEDLEGQPSGLVPRIREHAEGDPYQELLDGQRRELRGEIADDFPTHGYAVLEYRLTPLSVDGAIDGVVGVARDITDRRDRQAELERKDRAMDAAPVGITISDPSQDDNPLIYVNDRFTDVTGYSEEEVLGSNCRFLQGEHTNPEPVARMREAIDAAEAVTVELRNYREDGTEFWNRVSIAPVYNADGEHTNWVGFQQDVTAEKESERGLEETNAVLSTLFDTLPVGVLVEDARRTVLAINEQMVDLLEMAGTTEEVIGADCEQMTEQVSDMFVDADGFGDRIDELVANREPTDSEELSLTDGRTFERSYRPIELSDSEGHLWVYRDVTERKEQEREREATIEFLQTLYDVATNPELTADEKINRLLEFGPEKLGLPYGHLTRIERTENGSEGGTQTVIEASGDHDLLQPGDSCPLSRSYCRKTIGSEELLEIQDAIAAGWADDPAYETFDLGCYIGTAITIDDELYGTVFFASDTPRADPFTDAERTFVRLMSQLVSYELERKQVLRELERQNERLEGFASVVSHDLRNPLQVAEGRLELAREECESGHLDDVARAHERMHALIDDLLTLAREGEQVDELEPVDLSRLAERCWQNVTTADATLTVDVERTIQADRSRLQQLLENLTRNAVEHAGEDVTVTVGALDDGFYVEDDGPGIPDAELDTVFEAGYSTSEGETGFGLSIVDQIADAHGWDVRVTDGSRGGARFEITGVKHGTE